MSNIFEWKITKEYLILCLALLVPLQWFIILIAIIYYCATKIKIYKFFHMIFFNIALIILTITLLFYPSRDWSDKKKQKFLEQCYQTRISDLSIHYIGFSQTELEKILVRQIYNGKVLNEFYIVPEISKIDSTVYYQKFSPFMIHDTYQIIISEQTFTLSEIKFGLVPRVTMTSKFYECIIESYKVNDSVFIKPLSDKIIIDKENGIKLQ